MSKELKHPPGLPLRPAAKPKGSLAEARRLFARGLAVLLPTLLTLIILLWAYHILDTYVARHINAGLRYVVARAASTEKARVEEIWATYHLGWLGVVATLVLVLFIGMVVASYIGRGLWRLLEGILLRVPLIKQVYPYVKQVTDFLLSERPLEFSRVVLVEYPRPGCWSMGLITGLGFPALNKHTSSNLVTLFIPSSPMPVTGYVIQVARDEVFELDMTVDEALRFAITGGVVRPSWQPGERPTTTDNTEETQIARPG